MTPTITPEEMRQNVAEFIKLRDISSSRAWPRLGHDLKLADETDGQTGSLLFSCHTTESMSNPMGVVHGGVIASLADSCMGITCAVQCGNLVTPTITMTINYARPVPLGADVLVRTRTIRVGTTSGQMTAEVFLAEKPEEILVTSTGVYAIRR